MNKKEPYAKRINHLLFGAKASENETLKLCSEAQEYRFRMVAARVNRIGTRSGVSIINELKQE